MNSENPPPEDLKGRIKPCPVDFGRVENFIKRAKKDSASARFIEKSPQKELDF